MSAKYTVTFTDFAERYFIKKFHKKYKHAWDITREALIREFQSVDVLFAKSIAEVIIIGDGVKICKTEFTVAGTKKSRHGSGNRCIIAIHTAKKNIDVLLVYNKNDLPKGNETVVWKKIICENYQEYADILKDR